MNSCHTALKASIYLKNVYFAGGCNISSIGITADTDGRTAPSSTPAWTIVHEAALGVDVQGWHGATMVMDLIYTNGVCDVRSSPLCPARVAVAIVTNGCSFFSSLSVFSLALFLSLSVSLSVSLSYSLFFRIGLTLPQPLGGCTVLPPPPLPHS
jgi:hypothetical protein